VPKTIDSGVQTDIDSNRFAGVILARLHFDAPVGIQRFSQSAQSVYWDEDGGGDVKYLGVGNLSQITLLPESGELQSHTIQLSLSGIPNQIIDDVLGTTYMGKPVFLWYALLDTLTYAVEGGESGPVLVFAGLMDFATIKFGEISDITINATSRLADWGRVRGGRFNDSYQRTHVDPNDSGFEYVKALQDKTISWGGITLGDPGGTADPGGGPGGPDTPEDRLPE